MGMCHKTCPTSFQSHSVVFVVLFILGVHALVSCQESDSGKKPGNVPATLAGKSAGALPEGKTLKLKKHSCIDARGTGGEAFSLLIPAGWQFSGGVSWVFDNPTMPATIAFTVRNPSGHEEFEAFPTLAMFWTDNQMTMSMFPPGSRYYGSEVMPMVSAREALAKIILPRYRGGAADLKVVSIQPLPDLAMAVSASQGQPGVQAFIDAAKMRIEYTKNGTPMEEDIMTVVEGYTTSVPTFQGVYTSTPWFVSYAISNRAEKGKLAGNALLFRAMTDSFRVSPQWYNTYNQVVTILVQNQLKFIRSMGELSRYISQTSGEISESMMQSYNERQKIYDRIGEKMSETIRGTAQYYNPLEGTQVELPNGYKHVWASGTGEYLLTDSPGFNPNNGPGTTWQELEIRN